MVGKIVAICVSKERGTPKEPIDSARLLHRHGLEGDAHAGNWHRQVSLLQEEQIAAFSVGLKLIPGAFGENLVTRGIDLRALSVGSRLRIGSGAVLQITQRGKECHSHCAIHERIGDCVMPREGLFARVRRTGVIRSGDVLAYDKDLNRVRWAVCTLSDRAFAGERQDTAGPLVCELLEQILGHGPEWRMVLPDDRSAITSELKRLCDDEVCDLVMTTGGTGLSPRDVTPEATLDVVDRAVPGIAEAMRATGLLHTPHAMLSRGVCGQRGETMILNLSGSPQAVREQIAVVVPALTHAITVSSGVAVDCVPTVREHQHD